MKTKGLAARIRGRLGRSRPRSGAPAGHREHEVIEEIAAEFTTEELQEFLEGDLSPEQADPEFKESLRQELWELVKVRYGSQSRNESS